MMKFLKLKSTIPSPTPHRTLEMFSCKNWHINNDKFCQASKGHLQTAWSIRRKTPDVSVL